MIFVIALNIFASHRGGVNFRYLLSLTGLFNIIIMVLIFMHISQINSLDGRGITTSTILTQYNLAEDIVC